MIITWLRCGQAPFTVELLEQNHEKKSQCWKALSSMWKIRFTAALLGDVGVLPQ
jgi:hypothetical protein